MNWLALILRIVQIAPYMVAGVEAIHAGETSETKTQLATQSLMLATGAAEAIDPADTALIAGVSTIVGSIVKSVTPPPALAALLPFPAPAPAPAAPAVVALSAPVPAAIAQPAAYPAPSTVAVVESGVFRAAELNPGVTA
jgi:hypothetical protein